MTKNGRAIVAFLLAPIATLLLPVVGSLFVINAYHTTTVNPVDDAPIRPAALILFMTPIAYLVVAFVFFLTTCLLRRLSLLSGRSVVALVVISAAIIGTYIGVQSPFRVKDQLIGVGVCFSLMVFCFGLGASVWWIIARPRDIE